MCLWVYTIYLGLEKLKHKLDLRLQARELNSGRFKSMERIESTVSKLPPPRNPVKWAVCVTCSSSEAVVVESSDCSDYSTPTRYEALFVF